MEGAVGNAPVEVGTKYVAQLSTEDNEEQREPAASAAEEPAFPTYFVPLCSPPVAPQPTQQHLQYIPGRNSLLNDPSLVQLRQLFDVGEVTAEDDVHVGVSRWAQASFKYVFVDAFDTSLDWKEVQAIVTLLVSLLLNTVSLTASVVALRVGSNSPFYSVVAISEFAVLALLWALLAAEAVEAGCKRNFSTSVVIDVLFLCSKISSFSWLQSVNVISLATVTDTLLPLALQARTLRQYTAVVGAALLWLGVCFLAGLAVTLKISQVSFITDSVASWSLSQWLQLLGLILNISKIDASKEATTDALMLCAQLHFSGPGGPQPEYPKEEGLYARFAKKLGFQEPRSFELFEAIFNKHYGDSESDAQSAEGKWKKMANFAAFALRLSNAQLRQFLHMIFSPLPWYKKRRRNFGACACKNVAAMQHCLAQADPAGNAVECEFSEHPNEFSMCFVCEDQL